MRMPFVGRERELRALGRQLSAGGSVVLTGAYGSGRTTLIAELARRLPNRRFFWWRIGQSRRAMLGNVQRTAPVTTRIRAAVDPGIVIVVDDIVGVSAQRLRCLRELAASGRQIVAIVERSVPPDTVLRLRASLGAARLMVLDSLSSSAATRYFALSCQRLGLGWSRYEIGAMASATHGHPLTMRMTLEAAIARARSDAVERSTGFARHLEKGPSNGDGVRR